MSSNNTHSSPENWVPDESSNCCFRCKVEFTIINRRHHCRNCGRLFCASCSSKKYPILEKTTRVCDNCFYLLSHSLPIKGHKLVYKTRSLCPKCAFIEQKGIQIIDSFCFEKEDEYYLSVQCPSHGSFETLLCSNIDWLHSIQRYDNFIEDIEEMDLNNTPFMVECDLSFHQELIDRSHIITLLSWVRTKYQNSNFVIKFNGGLVNNISELNRELLFYASSHLLNGPCLIELSFERLLDICKLSDTCLLKSNLYPCLRYYLRDNLSDSDQCVAELTRMLQELRNNISDIQLILIISFDSPNIDLLKLSQYIFENRDILRIIIFSRERSPRRLLQAFESNSFVPISEDIYSILNHFEKNVPIWTINDFVPFRIMMILEVFLELIGLGKYRIRPPAFCAFVNILISFKEEMVPLTRIIDLGQFYDNIQPLMKTIETEGMGFIVLNSLKTVLSRCTRSGHSIPDIIDILKDPSQELVVRDFMNNIQFIIIHNMMDFASVDYLRRNQCPLINIGFEENNKIGCYASCLRCI